MKGGVGKCWRRRGKGHWGVGKVNEDVGPRCRVYESVESVLRCEKGERRCGGRHGGPQHTSSHTSFYTSPHLSTNLPQHPNTLYHTSPHTPTHFTTPPSTLPHTPTHFTNLLQPTGNVFNQILVIAQIKFVKTEKIQAISIN